ncbi:hypothetical protein ACTVZO_30460 [Streptomyces sp. IBSNAI002]|uniref:hypothetical protein n=1 Tax=Streptomyces sp. IBSNAI002 TaxID=3457500 RepID=UPI003FD26A04
MRYTRHALTIATTLLALTGIVTSAHADNNSDNKDRDGKTNICYIHVEGNHNHNACRDIKYGHNATTGLGHSVVGLGQLGNGSPCPTAGQYGFTITSLVSGTLTEVGSDTFAPPGFPTYIGGGMTTAPACGAAGAVVSYRDAAGGLYKLTVGANGSTTVTGGNSFENGGNVVFQP